MTQTLSIDDRAKHIADDFAFLDDWEERYNHIIALGRALPPMSEALINDATKVRGCASQVWMSGEVSQGVFHLQAASDAAIVSGLIALLVELYDNAPISTARGFDIEAFFDILGLKSSLSAQRANGLAAMVERIKAHLAQPY